MKKIKESFHTEEGVRYTVMTLCVLNGTPLLLYDVSYSSDLVNVTQTGASAAFIFFDTNRLSTLDGAIVWKKKVTLEEGDIPIILLANKVDLAKNTVWNSCLDMEALCKKYGFTTWYEVSAKDGTMVKEAFDEVIRLINNPQKVVEEECKELCKKVLHLEKENARLHKEIHDMEEALGIKGDQKVVNRLESILL
jgi:GTPase SAR1 family protein